MSATTVAEIMSTAGHTCRSSDTCGRAAQLMWEYDCGALPIVDARGTAVGMVTDRDICMAAHTQGKSVWQIPVTSASSLRVCSVDADDSIALALELMKMHRVRRLPVVDRGKNLVGILSLADIVRNARSTGQPNDALDSECVAAALAEVFRPHRQPHPVEGGPRCSLGSAA